MILIACVDDQMGILFNHRRQSQDKVFTQYVLNLPGRKGLLWVTPYTKAMLDQFEPGENVWVSKHPIANAGRGEYCWVEDTLGDIHRYEESIEKVLLCCWNRTYPVSSKFTLELTEEKGWTESEPPLEMVGFSHPKMTIRTFTRTV